MKKTFSGINAVIFALIFFIGCISSGFDKYKGAVLFGYFGPHSLTFTVIRYLVIILLIFSLTYINRNNQKLFYTVLPAELLIIGAAAVFDYFITKVFLYNYSYCLWLCAAVSVAAGALFLSALLFLKNDFDKFYKAVFRAYSVIYLLIFYVSFIRKPESLEMSVNLIPGGGTFQYFPYVFRGFDDPYLALICFGNILVFLPLPFIIKAFSFKIKDSVILIIGVLLPFLVEGYQYIFRCGHVDIDDVILNLSGFIIGFIIMKFVYSKKLKAS